MFTGNWRVPFDFQPEFSKTLSSGERPIATMNSPIGTVPVLGISNSYRSDNVYCKLTFCFLFSFVCHTFFLMLFVRRRVDRLNCRPCKVCTAYLESREQRLRKWLHDPILAWQPFPQELQMKLRCGSETRVCCLSNQRCLLSSSCWFRFYSPLLINSFLESIASTSVVFCK